MADYFALITTVGLGKLAAANAGGAQVVLADIAVGDSTGTPVQAATAVGGQQWRAAINRVYVDPAAPTRITVEGLIPASAGGWTIRQVGIFDNANQLFAIAKFPATYKPAPAEGAARDMVVNLVLEVGNAASVSITVNPSAVLATQAYVNAAVSGFAVPDATETVKGKAEIATTGEVAGGTDHTRIVTPFGLASRAATETMTGLVERATDAEAAAGTDTIRYITPKHLKDNVPLATTTVAGKVELATFAETQEMLDPLNNVVVTPAALNSRQASTSQTGLVERATDAEASAGLDTIRYITPKQLADAIANLVPTGTIRAAAYSSPDAGWLLCNGALVSTTTYAALFAKIGYTYGGSGSTFKLPDFRSRTIVGAGQGAGLTNRALGSQGGAEETPHDVPLPRHRHGSGANKKTGDSNVYGGIKSGTPTTANSMAGDQSSTTGWYTEYEGVDGASISVNKMQPYGTAHFFIKT